MASKLAGERAYLAARPRHRMERELGDAPVVGEDSYLTDFAKYNVLGVSLEEARQWAQLSQGEARFGLSTVARAHARQVARVSCAAAGCCSGERAYLAARPCHRMERELGDAPVVGEDSYLMEFSKYNVLGVSLEEVRQWAQLSQGECRFGLSTVARAHARQVSRVSCAAAGCCSGGVSQ
ncbi:MAG TPA: hypothetical protein VFQ91_15680 [Bryobacteraceae bacterium]|nr:hypothetical protein [Bryobacteraceae bacterium]